MVANKFLQDVEMNDDIRSASVIMCKSFHESVRMLSERFFFFSFFLIEPDFYCIYN